MPLPLRSGTGRDTIRKLEAAATRRYAEASRLSADEPLGALYLFGYVVEIRLKTAYYRLMGLAPDDLLDDRPAGAIGSPRALAEGQVRTLLGLGPGAPVGHNLNGWVQLIVSARTGHALGPLGADFEKELVDRVGEAAKCWAEFLRYRANRPYNRESEAVTAAARFLKLKYRTLWS
jgi:hypothetical protein